MRYYQINLGEGAFWEHTFLLQPAFGHTHPNVRPAIGSDPDIAVEGAHKCPFRFGPSSGKLAYRCQV